MVNVGYNNYVKIDKIVSIASVQKYMPVPIRRAIHQAQDEGKAIDLTAGRKTKSVIFTTSGYVVLSGLESRTIVQRGEGGAVC